MSAIWSVTPMRRSISVLTVCAWALGALACGSDKDTTPAEPPPTPTMTLVASANTLFAARGANAISRMIVSRGGAYAGAVALSLGALPTGVTGKFSRASLQPPLDTSVLNLEIDTLATPGTYSLLVRAVGDAGLHDSAMLVLEIPVPTLEVSIASATVNVPPGTTAQTIPVSVRRGNGFRGAVALSVVAPTNLSAQLQPSVVAEGVLTTNLILFPAETAANGPITVQVTATGSGVNPATAFYTVNVAAETHLFPSESRPTVTAGSRLQQSVMLTRKGSLERDVEVQVTGLPAGISGSMSPSVISSTQVFNPLTLTLDVAADVPAGVYPISLRSAFQGSPIGEYAIGMQVTVRRP